MFHKGATSVVYDGEGSYYLAVKGEGIYRFYNGQFKKVLTIENRILSLKKVGGNLFGVGDDGTMIKGTNSGERWNLAHLPTKARVWSVTGSDENIVATHGQHTIYLSENAGASWRTIKPFENLKNKPTIRSLCITSHFLFIGTQIHSLYGGIWMYSLKTGSLTHINKEEKAMISSLLTLNDSYLVAAKGSSKGRRGKIEYTPILTMERWIFKECKSPGTESCYLDLSEHNGEIYASSTQNRQGFSNIYSVDVYNSALHQCETVKGHGFRVANGEQDFMVAGLYESKYVGCKKDMFVLH